MLYGIKGKLLNGVKSLYVETQGCVRLNHIYNTEWFTTNTGVKQGDCLSTTLFALYINDLANQINNVKKGVKIGSSIVSILLYADDIVLLAENEGDLQQMLEIVENWCKKWRLAVNHDKSKIMHFRNARIKRSDFEFKLDNNVLEYVQDYKYLGLLLNEHMKYNNAAEMLSKAAGRALGACISKFKMLKNMGLQTYTTMYQTCVTSVMNYGAEIWGYKNFQCCDNVQLRAMKFFLGVNKFAPNVGVRGELDWLKPIYERWICVCRFWNRLLNMDESKLTYKLFRYDYTLCKKNWCADIKNIFNELNMSDVYERLSECSVEGVVNSLKVLNRSVWTKEVKEYSKLRTFVIFKKRCMEEKYLAFNLTRKERSCIAQLRLGVLPLRIETGRYKGEKEADRICVLCNTNQVENELHFLLHCPLYNIERSAFLEKIYVRHSNFSTLQDTEKIDWLMNNDIYSTIKYVVTAFDKRKLTLYK